VTHTDEIRSALRDATQLPGEVRVRPGAGYAVRGRARRHRRTTMLASALAVPVCVLLVTLLAGLGGGGTQRAVVPPAASPSPSATEQPVTLDPGPRTFAVPLTIHPVLDEFPVCPAGVTTVPADDGTRCYRLGPAALEIDEVDDLAAGPRTDPEGVTDGGVQLVLTMTAADAEAFARLTGRSVGEPIALVVDGIVYAAPQIAMRITGGQVALPLEEPTARSLVALLAG
jgi:hypothetical protein